MSMVLATVLTHVKGLNALLGEPWCCNVSVVGQTHGRFWKGHG